MEIAAINGGMPVRNETIYYGRQWIDEDDIKAVGDVLKSNYITCGPKVKELEPDMLSPSQTALQLFTVPASRQVLVRETRLLLLR